MSARKNVGERIRQQDIAMRNYLHNVGIITDRRLRETETLMQMRNIVKGRHPHHIE